MRRATFVDRMRERRRVLQVYEVFVRYGTEGLFQRGPLGGFRRRMQQWIHRPPYKLVPLTTPVKIRLMLQELGPTYVKMGQLVSSRSTALPPEWSRELALLQSDVKPFPFDEVREMIADELGRPLEEIYASFDPRPLGSASTAQVHRATLHDGSEVVVKVQRPNIQEALRADVDILRRAARLAERRTIWAREVGLVGVIDEFGSNLIEELDYGGEAFNARRMARNLDMLAGVHVPEIVREHSTGRVLTMELVTGVKISGFDEIVDAGLDPREVADRALRAAIKMLLIDGFFHADPHPGNVLVNLETGIVSFIDLGMVGEITLRQRLFLINLLLVANQGDALGLAQSLRSLSEKFGHVDDQAFYHDFQRRVGRYMEPGERPSFSRVMSTGLEVLRENGLRLDPALTLAIKALTQAEGFVVALYRRAGTGNFVESGIAMVEELVADNVTPAVIAEAAKKQFSFVAREVASRVPSLQEATGKWLDQYTKGQLSVKLDTSDLDSQVKVLAGVARFVTVGLVLSGIVIASGIAAAQAPDIGFVQEFAQFFYIGGVIAAALLVIVLGWRLARGGRNDGRF